MTRLCLPNLIAAARDTLEIATKNFGSNIEVYNAMLERMMEAAPQRIRVFVNPLEENLARQERILAEREARLSRKAQSGWKRPGRASTAWWLVVREGHHPYLGQDWLRQVHAGAADSAASSVDAGVDVALMHFG